jgi:hypothetical protein
MLLFERVPNDFIRVAIFVVQDIERIVFIEFIRYSKEGFSKFIVSLQPF